MPDISIFVNYRHNKAYVTAETEAGRRWLKRKMDVDDGKATIHKDSTEDFVQEIEESELTVDVRP